MTDIDWHVDHLKMEHVQDAALLNARFLPTQWSSGDFANAIEDPSMLALAATTAHVSRTVDALLGVILIRETSGEAEVLSLVVLADARRCSIGRALMRDAMQALERRGVTRVILEVAVDNRPALGLYRELGFRDIGRRVGYYRSADDVIDAVVLACDLVTAAD